ncbi:hypothetical protein L9F63_006062, partial [Diploptera punctata]
VGVENMEAQSESAQDSGQSALYRSSYSKSPDQDSLIGLRGYPESQFSQNSSMVPGSLSSDLSPEEIQKKLHELLQENLELKETLHQNNLAMKQQFATLAKWQDDVFNVFQNHKTKFAETKELVLKLRVENAELKRVLEDYKQAGSAIPSASDTQLKMENVELKGKIAELEQKLSAPIPRKDVGCPPNKKELELSALLEQVNRQLEIAERSRRQLTLDVEKLTAQRTRMEREMLAQKTELDQQKQQIQELTREKNSHKHQQIGTIVLETMVLCCEEHNGSDSKLRNGETSQPDVKLIQQLEQQKTTIRNLMQELHDEKAKVTAMTAQGLPIPSAQDKSNMAYNMKNYEQSLAQLSGCMDQDAVRLSSLDSWLQVAADNMSQWKGKETVDMNTVATLRAEVQELRKLLAQEQACSHEKRQCVEDSQNKLQELYLDYQKVVKELELLHREQRDRDQQSTTYLEVQARGFMEKIDRMTAQLLNKEEALTQKNKEVVQLKDKLKKLELENEAITISKQFSAQVEVYQSDFNAEREARENLAGEKERLAEDLRHLQRRNQQLLDDLDAYQQNQFEQIQRQTPQTTNSQNSIVTGWNTIATPGRSPARSSPARPSPARSVSGSQQLPEVDDTSPFRVRGYDEEVPTPKRYFCPV